MMVRTLIILFCGLLFTSCSDVRVYEKVYTLDDREWSYGDSLEFSFDVRDTSQLYGLGINASFSDAYPYENIYTKIKTILPNGEIKANLFSIELQNSSKRRSLRCTKEYCTADVFLQAPLKFIDKGNYTIRIIQHSRDEDLNGVRGIGLYLEKLKNVYKKN